MRLVLLTSSISLFLYATAVGCQMAKEDGKARDLACGSDPAHDVGLFSLLDDLSPLSEKRFTTLRLPEYPKYGVRIKKSKFCDGTVESYTWYIDAGARRLFFYFFGSRSEPDNGDVILWTNGGRAGRLRLGFSWNRVGPRRIVHGNTTKFHPESWNSKANMFFIGQPVGLGWSYADSGEYVGTTEEAAADTAAFVVIFFEHFHKFKGRAFHMAGESYGGRFIPVFAATVYDQNRELVRKGWTPINLRSIMLGNGWADFYTMILSYYDMTCAPASIPPVLDIQACVRMK